MSFWETYWHVIAFYVILSFVIYLNRRKFEFEGKIVALLRTNTGLDWMNTYGAKHARMLRFLGTIGIYVGYAGMLVILGFLVFGIHQLIFRPEAPPVLSPVLPGITIPGTEITVPLFEGIIALFIVIIVHEAAHGLVSAAYGMKVKGSGVGFLGPIPLAFVEPDEKKLSHASPKAQLAVYAAGPWSNVLQAILFFGLLVGFAFLINPLFETEGIGFQAIVEGTPAELAGLQTNTTYTHINDIPLTSSQVLITALQQQQPGDVITLRTAEQDIPVTLGAHEERESVCLGVAGMYIVVGENDISQTNPVFLKVLFFIRDIIYWVFVLALGLGLANLLPLGPVDGGRMLHVPLVGLFGKEKGERIWANTSIFILVVVLVLVFVPIIKLFLPQPEIVSTVIRCLPV